jgi:hypothetical protein
MHGIGERGKGGYREAPILSRQLFGGAVEMQPLRSGLAQRPDETSAYRLRGNGLCGVIGFAAMEDAKVKLQVPVAVQSDA